MQRSLLAPGCEKAPLNPDLQYVPPDSAPHKVSERDSWWTLADRPEVKAAKLSALDLCVFNFRTRKPAEINWYLRNKVGCTSTTTDRKNYKFSDDASPGIVYLPKPKTGSAPIVLDDVTVVGRVPGSLDVNAAEEFTIDKESNVFRFRYVHAQLKVAGKLTVEWGGVSHDVRIKASNSFKSGKFGVGGEARIAQDLSVQFGLKVKIEDAKKPSEWKRALKEASEVSLKHKFRHLIFSSISTGFCIPKGGLFYFVKLGVQELKLDNTTLQLFVDDLPEYPVSVKLGGDFTLLLGPGEAQLRQLVHPGTGLLVGLAAWVAFAGYGIAHTMNKADRMAYESWYITGYVDAVFPPHGGGGGHQLPLKPAERAKAEQMMQLGRRDAEMTARTEFGNDGLPPMQAYGLYVMSMLDADNDPYATRQVRGLMRDLVHEKLKQMPAAN